MESNRSSQLIAELLDATKRGAVTWRKGFVGEYVLSFPNHSVEISQPSNDYHYISLFNDAGLQIDRMASNELDDAACENLVTLYQLVRRKALGVDEAIDEIIARLRKAS